MTRWADGVVIYGMGRSGTSAVTALFAKAGYFVGAERDLLPANEGNPTGYYENRTTMELNDSILAELDGSWFAPPAEDRMAVAQERYEPRLQAAFDALRAQAHGAPVAMKDPRLQVMLPLWEPVIGGRLYPVMVVRDPLEIALSLARRDGTPIPFSLAAWEISMTRLLRGLRGREVTVAPYRHLLGSREAAREVVQQASERLRVEYVGHVVAEVASDVLRGDLHRNRADATDHDQYLTQRQAQLWDWLTLLPPATVELNPPCGLLPTSGAAEEAAKHEHARWAAAGLANQLAELQTALDGTRADAARARERGRELDVELEQAFARARSLEDRMRELQGALNETRAARDQAQATLDSIVRSRSWRATAVLRRMFARARRR